MQDKNINFELQSRVRKYLEYVMKKDVNDEQENEILGKLNKALKNEVILQSRGKLLAQNSLFKDNFSKNSIDALSLKLKKLTIGPEEIVYKVIFLKTSSEYLFIHLAKSISQ
jgi:hypothetical protein